MNGFVEMENNAMVNAEKRKLSRSDTPNPKWQALEEAQKREERIPLIKTLQSRWYEEIEGLQIDEIMEDVQESANYQTKEPLESLKRIFGPKKPKTKIVRKVDDLKNVTNIQKIQEWLLETPVSVMLRELLGMSKKLH